MRKPQSVRDSHLRACLVLRRDLGVVLYASSPSIAARIHSRAMSNSFSRSSGVLAAAETKSERHRQVLLEMAKTWTQAALEIERSWGLIDDVLTPSRRPGPKPAK